MKSFPGETQSNTRSPAADDPQFGPRKPSDFFYFSQDVADPHSTMVRRPLAWRFLPIGVTLTAMVLPGERVLVTVAVILCLVFAYLTMNKLQEVAPIQRRTEPKH